MLIFMVRNSEDIEITDVQGDDVHGVKKQIAIGPKEGWQEGYMRVFTIEPGGNTPAHSHSWWHVNYVLEGEGTIEIEGIKYPVKKGSVAYIDPNRAHQFVNTGKTALKFICLVPPEGDHY